MVFFMEISGPKEPDVLGPVASALEGEGAKVLDHIARCDWGSINGLIVELPNDEHLTEILQRTEGELDGATVRVIRIA